MKDKIFQIITPKGYVITEYDDGSWACSCPAWKFHRGERVDCKHILEIKNQTNNQTNLVVQSSNSQDTNKQRLETLPYRNSESFSCEDI